MFRHSPLHSEIAFKVFQCPVYLGPARATHVHGLMFDPLTSGTWRDQSKVWIVYNVNCIGEAKGSTVLPAIVYHLCHIVGSGSEAHFHSTVPRPLGVVTKFTKILTLVGGFFGFF